MSSGPSTQRSQKVVIFVHRVMQKCSWLMEQKIIQLFMEIIRTHIHTQRDDTFVLSSLSPWNHNIRKPLSSRIGKIGKIVWPLPSLHSPTPSASQPHAEISFEQNRNIRSQKQSGKRKGEDEVWSSRSHGRIIKIKQSHPRNEEKLERARENRNCRKHPKN